MNDKTETLIVNLRAQGYTTREREDGHYDVYDGHVLIGTVYEPEIRVPVRVPPKRFSWFRR